MVAGAHLVSVQDQAERGGVQGLNGELGRWTYCYFLQRNNEPVSLLSGGKGVIFPLLC